MECRLLTGRTHQIRVSMAEIGCPLLGDGKYGRGDVNRRYHETRQALYSYKLRLPLSHRRRGAELPAGQDVHRGGGALPGQVFPRAGDPGKKSCKIVMKSLILLDIFHLFGYHLLLLNFDEKGSPSTEKRGVSSTFIFI